MNLGRLIQECQFRSGLNDSDYRAKWVSFLNEGVREFASVQPWEGLEDVVDLYADGTKYLILPPHVDTIVGLFDVANAAPVERRGPIERFTPAIEALNTAGRAVHYDLAGDVAATKDPAGHIWLASSHASDYQDVTVTGVVTNTAATGALRSTIASLTLSSSGSTPVTLSTLFSRLLSVSRATEANGDFWFYDAGSGNLPVSCILKNETTAGFKRVQLAYVPAAGTQLRLRYRPKLPQLREESEAPHPNVDCGFVIEFALAKHWEEQEQLSKSEAKLASALRRVERRANKDLGFNEPYSQIQPQIYVDPDDWTRFR